MIFNNYKKLIYLGILTVIFLGVMFAIKYYFKPFLSIIIILILSTPIYKFMCNIKMNKNIAAALSIMVVNIAAILFLIYLGNNIVYAVKKIYSTNMNIFDEMLKQLLENVDLNAMKNIENIFSFFKSSNFSIKAMTSGQNLITAFTENMFAYFIGNISTFFILVDREKIKNLLELLIPRELISKTFMQSDNFIKMFKIQLILVIISTMEITVGFLILRISNGIFLGILSGVLDILPYVGTIIVFIPIIIYNIIIKNYLIAFGLLCLYILVSVVREILEAKYLSTSLKVHPLVIMISLYIGFNVFGILGVLAGPMYSIMAKEIIYCDI